MIIIHRTNAPVYNQSIDFAIYPYTFITFSYPDIRWQRTALVATATAAATAAATAEAAAALHAATGLRGLISHHQRQEDRK